MAVKEELESVIKDAEKLHGHLGPFLVIGVRIGQTAKKVLLANLKESDKLEATDKLPLSPPFSCILDGIQASAHCTIGNQRLKIENLKGEMTVHFKLRNSSKILKISINQKIIEELMNKISEGNSSEDLAWKIARTPENELFTKEENVLNDIELAKKNLKEKSLNLSIVNKGKVIFEAASTGISGFLEAIEKIGNELSGASVADRVAGKAIALLCVHAKIRAIYAETMSKAAKAVFEDYAIYHEWNVLIDNVCGANGTICPFEKLAMEISNPQNAYERLKALSLSVKYACGKE
jgi:formylmethanofuran dehydrogenase subunit E